MAYSADALGYGTHFCEPELAAELKKGTFSLADAPSCDACLANWGGNGRAGVGWAIMPAGP